MINAVLFDLDGTLLDTAPDLVGALNHARSLEGLEALPVAAYSRYVSRGAAGLIEAGFPVADEQLTEQRKQRLLAHYRSNLYQQSRPFEGVVSLLDRLQQAGVVWGIVTNKGESLTLPLLKQAGILNRAGCVVCGDTLSFSKPHPAPVLLACEILQQRVEHTIMVGDDLRDIAAGNAAGTHTALAEYGYLEPADINQELPGTFRIRRALDLLPVLADQSASG